MDTSSLMGLTPFLAVAIAVPLASRLAGVELSEEIPLYVLELVFSLFSITPILSILVWLQARTEGYVFLGGEEVFLSLMSILKSATLQDDVAYSTLLPVILFVFLIQTLIGVRVATLFLRRPFRTSLFSYSLCLIISCGITVALLMFFRSVNWW